MGVAFLLFAVAAGAEPKQFFVPVFAFEQQVSARMEETLTALEKQHALPGLEGWVPLAEMPDWVFEPAEREIAYLFDHPAKSDGYRYAIIVGKYEELIVVRVGGIAGRSQIFRGFGFSTALSVTARPPFSFRPIPAPARASIGVSVLQ